MSIDEQAGIVDEKLEPVVEQEVIQEKPGGIQLPDWVYLPASKKPIEDFIDHPLNFKRSMGFAQIIRGVSVPLGAILDYWWTDVIMGGLRMRSEGKGGVGQ